MRGIFQRSMCWQRAASRTTTRRIRREAGEHRRHPLRVDELLRACDAIDHLAIGIGRVGRVEAGDRALEARRGDPASTGKLGLDLREGMRDIERGDGPAELPSDLRGREDAAHVILAREAVAIDHKRVLPVCFAECRDDVPDLGAQHLLDLEDLDQPVRQQDVGDRQLAVSAAAIVQQVDGLFADDVVRGDDALRPLR